MRYLASQRVLEAVVDKQVDGCTLAAAHAVGRMRDNEVGKPLVPPEKGAGCDKVIVDTTSEQDLKSEQKVRRSKWTWRNGAYPGDEILDLMTGEDIFRVPGVEVVRVEVLGPAVDGVADGFVPGDGTNFGGGGCLGKA